MRKPLISPTAAENALLRWHMPKNADPAFGLVAEVAFR
jgi:hypothetical protein